MTHRQRLAVFIGVLFAAHAADAKVYRCGADGKTVQDTPCPVVNAPVPPPPKPPCDLDADAYRRAVRSEEQFLQRFPDDAAHRRALRGDLQPALDGIGTTTRRLEQLLAERAPIDNELAFYAKTPPPPDLKAKVDRSDAQLRALADLFRGHEQTIGVVQARYACERATYGKRWTGAAPGASACDRPACAPRSD